jgi:hypothetical protein
MTTRKLLLFAAPILVLLIPGAFFLGRETAAKTGSVPSRPTTPPVETTVRLRGGERVIYQQAATECFATGEAGYPLLLCEPIGRSSGYEVGFYSDEFLVYAGPDHIPFQRPWSDKPRRRFSTNGSR